MNRFGAGILAVLVLSGCGDDSTVTPAPRLPPPAPPEPPPTPEPDPDPDALPIGFRGVLPAPGTALTLHPGTEFVIPVTVDGDLSEYVRLPDWTGISVRVVTDAPAEVLSVPAELIVEARREPDLLTIRALAAADFRRTYEVRLESPPEGFPEPSGLSFRLDSASVQVRVADPGPAEEADCDGFSLAAGAVRSGDGGALGTNWFGDVGSDYRSADVTLRSPAANAELRLLSDYQQLPYGDFGDAYNLVPVMFAFGLELEERGAGLEQTLSLAWFDELRLRAAIPGCTPVEVHCTDRGRCRTR